MISEHLTSWLGYPVLPLGFKEIKGRLPDLSKVICRLYVEYDDEESFADLLEKFLQLPNAQKAPAIIVGAFSGDDPQHGTEDVVASLVRAQPKLPAIKGIFLGDILSEENEISWIVQSDVSPLYAAYPKLEALAIRGTNSLSLGEVRHDTLKSLVIETGGLPRSVLAELALAKLPNLEHLELWLGTDNYGWNGTVADLQPLIDGARFPKLKYLGLRNSEIQDDVAAHIAFSPIIKQLEILDLSLGNMTDVGAEALLRNQGLARLQKLDLHHHYISDKQAAKLKAAFPHADLSDIQVPDGEGDDAYRNIAVSE